MGERESGRGVGEGERERERERGTVAGHTIPWGMHTSVQPAVLRVLGRVHAQICEALCLPEGGGSSRDVPPLERKGTPVLRN
eukprot:2790969-Rhodomonas_salina.1